MKLKNVFFYEIFMKPRDIINFDKICTFSRLISLQEEATARSLGMPFKTI